MGSAETLWPDRLWLAFARTELPEADLTVLDLGRHPLGDDAQRGAAYAAAVHRLKELPDAERADRLETLLAALGADVTEPGPFRLLSWDEAHELTRAAEVALYPHTSTHPILSRCSDDKVEREVSESCAILERETGCAPVIFAYPNGRAQDFDDRAKAALRRRGCVGRCRRRTGSPTGRRIRWRCRASVSAAICPRRASACWSRVYRADAGDRR